MFKKLFGFYFFMPFMDEDDGTPAGGGSDTNEEFKDESSEDEEASADDLLAALTGEDTEEDEPKEEEEKGDEKPEEKLVEKKEEPPKTFTQADIDRIIGERLARERKTQEEQNSRLHQEQQQQQQVQQWYNDRLNAKTTRYEEVMGLDKDTALKLATEDMQGELKVKQVEIQLQEQQKQVAVTQQVSKYNQDKSETVTKNPVIAKYLKEIDEFSGGGSQLDFDTAMKYVIGGKIVSGELTNDIKTAAEQKTLKNVSKRSKIGTEKGGQSSSTASQLTKDELLMCKALGVTPKTYAANKKKK